MATALVWFRRDLRASDHPALAAAVASADRVVPLFVWDDRLLASSGPNRLAFLGRCLDELRTVLGGSLVTRRGRPAEQVTEVARALDASEVFVSADFGPYGRARDAEVARALGEEGRTLRAVGSPYAVDPGLLLTAEARPFQVFTPYWRAWQAHGWEGPTPEPDLSTVGDGGIEGHGDPDIPALPAGWAEPGALAGRDLLDDFVRQHLDRYARDRDRPDLDLTSRLSPYLRFGCVHPREILARLDPLRPGHDRFAAELCWREFHADLLYHRPDAARLPYKKEWLGLEVDSGPEADERFDAWARGRTGYPFVDAGMRQLLAEGWMPNRTRMVAASFLVKDLHLDWRRGARWFMRHLIDGDLASNQLNWQWVAGCGTDAAPYFRIFNPVLQGRRFDPAGDYVRRWVPELAGLPAPEVHEPWRHGGHPAPVVDHATERVEALERYRRLRAST